MKSQVPRVLVITGDGIRGDVETAQAFRLAKFDAEIRHLNDLIQERIQLDELCRRYGAIAFPGGFSFGDDLGAGKILALKITHQLGWDLNTYAARGGLVLGIGNGFQALVRMRIFGKDISITHNLNGKFMSLWTKVTPVGNRCVWLRGIGTIDLPIRHAEGRVVIGVSRRAETLVKIERLGMACLKYEDNPTGSEESLAGMSDPTGRIFGLMPHPEIYVRGTTHPEWTAHRGRAAAPGLGLALFENAYRELAQ
jgi:phosphoribosylformylglycinamidine synthase